MGSTNILACKVALTTVRIPGQQKWKPRDQVPARLSSGRDAVPETLQRPQKPEIRQLSRATRGCIQGDFSAELRGGWQKIGKREMGEKISVHANLLHHFTLTQRKTNCQRK